MISPSIRIFACTEPQDMRRAFDGLALATKKVLGQDPQSGALFIFVNKRKNRMKILWWDRNGYCLLCKRLHRAKFILPASAGTRPTVQIESRQLAKILAGVEIQKNRRRHS